MNASIMPSAGETGEPDLHADTLLPALQSASAGHRRLDLMIAFALGHIDIDSGTVLRVLLDNAMEQDDPAALLGANCPHYTTSLDAGIPGENIILALYQPQRRAWTAVHRCEHGDIVGTGASEVLARRVAALKATVPVRDDRFDAPHAPAAVATRPRPSDPPPGSAAMPEPDSPPPPPEPGRGRSGPDETGDWEILW